MLRRPAVPWAVALRAEAAEEQAAVEQAAVEAARRAKRRFATRRKAWLSGQTALHWARSPKEKEQQAFLDACWPATSVLRRRERPYRKPEPHRSAGQTEGWYWLADEPEAAGVVRWSSLPVELLTIPRERRNYARKASWPDATSWLKRQAKA